MSEYALRLANGSDTAPRVRAGDALALTPNGAVRARGGLRPDGGGAVSVVAGTMSVQVTAFSCWVDASPAGQVGYPFVCDATKTLAIDPGDATLSRTDVVAVVVKENAYDGSGTTSAVLTVVKGTPGAGTPAMPTSACIPLRNITVPAGTSVGSGGLSSGNLSTDRRVYTVAVGGVLPCTSTTRPASPFAGMAIFETDTKREFRWDGTVWRPANPAAMPFFKGVISASTALSVGANIAFSAAEDTHGGWSTNKYTVPVSGLYRVSLWLKFSGTPAGPIVPQLIKNAGAVFSGPQQSNSPAFGAVHLNTTLRLVAADQLSAQIAQASMTTQSDSPAENNHFVIEYVRP